MFKIKSLPIDQSVVPWSLVQIRRVSEEVIVFRHDLYKRERFWSEGTRICVSFFSWMLPGQHVGVVGSGGRPPLFV